MLVQLLLNLLPKEKSVGQGYHVVWHVLVSLVGIGAVSSIAIITGHLFYGGGILSAGLFAFSVAILRPSKQFFKTELLEDYQSFLPHFSKHLYRDLTQFLGLLSAHIASLLCLVTAPLNLFSRPSVSCEKATHHSAAFQCLLLASTHVLRAPPQLA